LYAAACKSGSADACAQYGYVLMSAGKREAVKVLEDACDGRSGAACTHLAYLDAVGKIVERDDLRSLEFYTRGCSFGDSNGCYNQGLMRDQGRGFAMSAASAAPAYEQACNEGVSKACTNLGFLYENGKGVRKDVVRAAGFYRRGCEGSPCEASNLLGCVNLGDAYRDGIGVEKNPALAAATFRKACESKIDPQNEDEEARVHACVLLGALEIHGLGVPEDEEGGIARSLDGCNRGDAYGCFNVAAMRAYGEDFSGAATFYDRACKGGDAEGCYELGKLYDEAKGVAFDHEMKEALFAQACKGGFMAACSR
jgi:TPR repeat protein